MLHRGNRQWASGAGAEATAVTGLDVEMVVGVTAEEMGMKRECARFTLVFPREVRCSTGDSVSCVFVVSGEDFGQQML